MTKPLSTYKAVALFAVVVLAWGTNWPVTKLIVEAVPPLWATALRCWIALIALLLILPLTGNLIFPRRGDIPVVLSVALLHMILFATLVASGLQHLPAGKAIVLGYTTPLWVAIAAPILINERLTPGRILGVSMGLAGLGVILTPRSLSWADGSVIIGSAKIILAAVCWAASILYIRAHRWIATPLQLVLWQILIATLVLSTTAIAVEGWPRIAWSQRLILLFLYGGLVGTALAYWAMSIVNKNLSALTTSLGTTATPVVGIVSAAIALGEAVDLMLVAAAALIIGGIVLNTLADARNANTSNIAGDVN